MLKRIPGTDFIPLLGGFALAVSFLACAPPHESGPDASSKGGGEAAAGSRSAESQTTRSAGSARDFESLDVCVLVPVAEVAVVLGHEPATGSATPTMGRFATDCTYSFERGDGFSDHAMIWVYPPQLWAPEAKGEIEEVAGLGDRAFLSSSGSFAQANVLLAGDLYLDTRAGTANQARALAELALARLTAMGDDR